MMMIMICEYDASMMLVNIVGSAKSLSMSSLSHNCNYDCDYDYDDLVVIVTMK